MNTNVFAGNPDLIIQLDASKAERLGLKPDAVARQLKAMFLGQIAAKVQESSARMTDVRVRYPDAFRFGPGRFDADFGQAAVDHAAAGRRRRAGQPPACGPARAVPLSALATVTPVRTPDEHWRENQQPAIFVTAELQRRGSRARLRGRRHPQLDGRRAAAGRLSLGTRRPLPPATGGVPQPARRHGGGRRARLHHAGLPVPLGALPLLIFLTQPLSLVSGLLALWLTNTPLNVSSYMGAILLIGLDMKNGILLVEYIQQLRAEGMELRPALLQAGRTRFRPILMTSLAAILGLCPLALGIGPGRRCSSRWRSWSSAA